MLSMIADMQSSTVVPRGPGALPNSSRSFHGLSTTRTNTIVWEVKVLRDLSEGFSRGNKGYMIAVGSTLYHEALEGFPTRGKD